MAQPRISGRARSLRVSQNDIGGLLADHVNRADDEESWDSRENRSIDNA